TTGSRNIEGSGKSVSTASTTICGSSRRKSTKTNGVTNRAISRSNANGRSNVATRNSIDLDRDPHSIIGTRVLAAPRALVFSAWTDPKHLVQWWGPRQVPVDRGARARHSRIRRRQGPRADDGEARRLSRSARHGAHVDARQRISGERSQCFAQVICAPA